MIELVVLTLSALVSVVLGAWIGNHWTKRMERVQATLDLYRKFYDPEMHRARVLGAKTLLDSARAHTFNTLWEDDELESCYEALTQVVYFWFALAELSRVKMIDKPLASRLFAYPFEYWKPLLELLDENTRREGSTTQDWSTVVREDELDWLLRSARSV